MDVPNSDRIDELIRHRAPICASVFMPTHRRGRRELQQDKIRLKNLIRQAREAMLAQAGSSDVDDVLQPAVDLQFDESLWRERSDGLACFCAPDFFRTFRVPFALDEQWFVNDRFHIRPLLPLFHSDAKLYMLALTQQSARLFEATRFSLHEIELPEIPRAEVDGTEQALQYHSHQAPTQGKGGTQEAVYHGHGGVADRSKKDTLRYFQQVDRAVTRALRGQSAPLILACVGYLAPLYESTNRYANLIKDKVPGSPDRWREDELREHAWKLVEPHLRRKQQRAWQDYQRAKNADAASDDLRTIVLAADQGRVDTLFLTRTDQRFGHVDAEHQDVQIDSDQQEPHEPPRQESLRHEPPREELLDFAAAQTVSNGGDVFMVDTLPDTDSPVAATFRYSLQQ